MEARSRRGKLIKKQIEKKLAWKGLPELLTEYSAEVKNKCKRDLAESEKNMIRIGNENTARA